MVDLISNQSKQIQIDDLLNKIDGHADEVEHLREEKDQEIAIMDSTIQQLAETQQVIV